MSKIKIIGSEFSDTDLKFSVCSHLQPILDWLKHRGIVFEQDAPMFRDKGGGATRFVSGPIDFEQLKNAFEIPKHIKLNRDEKAIVCTRCWCAIAEGRAG